MNLVERQVAELTGNALNWAMASATGMDKRLESYNGHHYVPGHCGESWSTSQYISSLKRWAPSTDYSQGGPLMDEYRITHGFDSGDGGVWSAELNDGTYEVGPTRLIASCRAIVASHFGTSVQIPEELTCPTTRTSK